MLVLSEADPFLVTAPSFLDALADLWDPPPNPYLNDPVRWVEERTGEYLWSKQREIAEALLTHRKVLVQAGHGVGKSFVASRIGTWWVDVHPPKDTWLITTAPTHDQVAGILWQELAMAHEAGGLAGAITGDCRWRIGKLMVGQGRKPADYSQHAFQGLHRDFVLVIIDEACGVSPNIFEGASNIVTGPTCRTLAIGNPDDPNSTMAKLAAGAPEDGSSGMSAAGWYVIRISVFDSPNWTGEEVPPQVRERMPSAEWVEEKRREVGEGSPLWISKVLGRFPEDASDGIIPYSWVRTCMHERTWDQTALFPVRLGIDVGASDNGDQTVVRERRGPKLGRVWRFRERDHTQLLPKIVALIIETGATEVAIDCTGVGHGLANMVTQQRSMGQHTASVQEVNFGSAAHANKRFANKRAEMFWGFRELVQTQAVELSGMEDHVLAELCGPTYTEDTTGRIKVSPKSDLSARLGRSPDDGDAVLLAYYEAPEVSYGDWTEDY